MPVKPVIPPEEDVQPFVRRLVIVALPILIGLAVAVYSIVSFITHRQDPALMARYADACRSLGANYTPYGVESVAGSRVAVHCKGVRANSPDYDTVTVPAR